MPQINLLDMPLAEQAQTLAARRHALWLPLGGHGVLPASTSSVSGHCHYATAGRGIPIMLRGITKHPLNLRESSRTLLHMKTPKRLVLQWAKNVLIYGMQFAL